MRTSLLTVTGYGFSQAVRLVSNFVLARLLFPEAFGLMAMVTVFLIGLNMLSDVGIGPSIAHSRRGDDPDFLDTAWTIQIVRGGALFVTGCLLAWPVSVLYGQPELLGMLLVASTQMLVTGCMPTRRETASRHLRMGHVTAVEMASQIATLCVMVSLAFTMRSVWALVVGSVIGATIQVTLMSLFLPGARNRLRWERDSARELVHFGKWIFASTICGFLLTQSDKLILGKLLPLDEFGLYNIGFLLGSFPMTLGMVAVIRVLIPVYRDRPPANSRENFLKLRRMRCAVTSALLAMLALIAFGGVWLVDLLYDDRYHAAGAVVVLVACVQIPVIIGLTYDQAALAAGDSRRFFIASATKAALMVLSLYIGVQTGGLVGGLVAQGVAVIAAYPALIWLVSRVRAWDPVHDLTFAGLGTLVAAAAMWWNWTEIARLAS